MSGRVFAEVFPGTPAGVGRAREWLGETLAKEDVAAAGIEAAVLVASELSTNSVRHSLSGAEGGVFTVHVLIGSAGLRLGVCDQGGNSVPMARRGEPDPFAESGYGLVLVDAYARDWRVLGGTHGRTVLADIDAGAPAAVGGQE